MLILTQTTDSIDVVLASAPAAQLPVAAFYRDIDSTSYLPGRTVLNTAGVTAVEAVPGPPASTQRVVDFINIYNPNAANATVTVRYDLAGTPFVLASVVLSQGERLTYQEGTGWQAFTAAGALKNSLNQGVNAVAAGDSVVVLGGNIVNNNAVANTIQSITGLQFPVVAGTRYAFEFHIDYSAAATTTGSRFSITGPTFTRLSYESHYSLTATSRTFNTGAAAYDLPAASNASSASTASNYALIRGIILPSANGDVVARFASEVANSAITALTGSFVRFRALI